MKYRVDLEFTSYGHEVEADSGDEAVMKALIQLTNNPYDFFTAEDEIANKILANFNDYSNWEIIEE